VLSIGVVLTFHSVRVTNAEKRGRTQCCGEWWPIRISVRNCWKVSAARWQLIGKCQKSWQSCFTVPDFYRSESFSKTTCGTFCWVCNCVSVYVHWPNDAASRNLNACSHCANMHILIVREFMLSSSKKINEPAMKTMTSSTVCIPDYVINFSSHMIFVVTLVVKF